MDLNLDDDEQPTGHMRWFEVEPGEMELQQLWQRRSTLELGWRAVRAFNKRGDEVLPPRSPAGAVAQAGRRFQR